MIKNLIVRLILVSVIFSSLFAIYRQIVIIRGAQSSVLDLDSKINKLELRNKALQDALK